jgi:hypothetical protein
MATARAAKVSLMRKAAAAVRHRGLRAAWNEWAANAAARGAALSLMTRAAASIRNRGLRAGLNTWRAVARERKKAMTKLRRATAALTMRGQRLGMNAWIELAAELERRRALVRSMTPEARAMRRALNSWREVYEERLLMMKVTTARARPPAHPPRSSPAAHALFTTARAAGAPRSPHAASRIPQI